MLDCLFIGSSTQDLMLLVDAPPLSDQRIVALKKSYTSGGIAATAASAFQKLGGKTGLITTVGDDSDETSYIKKDLAERHLSYLKVIKIPGAESSFSAIQIERNGKRCITHYGGCIKELNLGLLDFEVLQETKIIHLGGLDGQFIVKLAKYCKENTNAMVSIDGGNYSRDVLNSLVPYVDIMILDDKTVENAYGFSNKEACKYFADCGIPISCVTLGPKGAIAFQKGQYFFQPAMKINVLDTTGAGDNFHGAFLYCLLQQFDLSKILLFCNAFSAITCTAMGGRVGEPTFEETIQFIKDRGLKW